jgi:hypothetical protein
MPDDRRCAALTRDGERCRSAAVTDAEFCRYHLGLVAEHGDEALKGGDHVRRRRLRVVREPVAVNARRTVW